MASSKVFNIESWNVRGVMPKLMEIKVVLGGKKLTSAKLKNEKQTQWMKISTATLTYVPGEKRKETIGTGIPGQQIAKNH